MVVLVLSACPARLRGHLTRWLLEVAPGVFVGRLSARVRDQLWDLVRELVGVGRALMVHSAQNEQGMAFRTHGHDWAPVDFEGVTLMMRPNGSQHRQQMQRRSGWSRTSGQRFSRRPNWGRRADHER